MGAAEILMKVDGQERYRALTRRLKDASRGDLQRALNKSIRATGAPALAATKAAWRTVDVTPLVGEGPKSTGLRRRVADATRISVLQRGIRIRVEGKKVDPKYGRGLAWYLDGMGKPWRHPVYGRRSDPWAVQRGDEVFFTTLDRYESAWRAGIEQAMRDTARQIEG